MGHAEIKPAKVAEGYELIYGLAFEMWGQGLGTELAEVLLAHGFSTLGLSEVYATVTEQNRASLATLRKIGFRPVRNITAGGREHHPSAVAHWRPRRQYFARDARRVGSPLYGNCVRGGADSEEAVVERAVDTCWW